MTDPARRLVLITGSSGEIGSHLGRHFVSGGWRVLGLDAREADPPPGFPFSRCDLVDGPQATAAIDTFAQTHGACDVLVNCAGRIANAPLVRLDNGEWKIHDFSVWNDVIASGLTTAFHATAVTVKHMLSARKKGVVVNISSVAAKGTAGQAAYSAAKAGLNGLTLALAKELGPLGIRVAGVEPGYFDTASMHAHVSEGRLAKVIGRVPLRRLGTLAELALAVDFVIGNEYVTGTTIELNGGLVV